MKTFLTNDEIKRMIEAAPCLRDKVFMAFYFDTGCRVSELLSVKVENIDLDQGTVLIPHLKRGIRKYCPGCGRAAGRRSAFCAKCGYNLSDIIPQGTELRSRLISIGEETIALLHDWIKGMRPDEPLIKLSRQQINNIVRELAASIGLKGKVMLNPETGKKHYVHPHNLRDSLAVDWLTLRGDVEGQKALQQHLGHRSFETTARYYKLTPQATRRIGDEVRRARLGTK